jgi:hypothetical protein
MKTLLPRAGTPWSVGKSRCGRRCFAAGLLVIVSLDTAEMGKPVESPSPVPLSRARGLKRAPTKGTRYGNGYGQGQGWGGPAKGPGNGSAGKLTPGLPKAEREGRQRAQKG